MNTQPKYENETYETKRIRIVWNGHLQMGAYHSFNDAKQVIEKTKNGFVNNSDVWQIQTPTGTYKV
jgi:hypothetical protein